MVYHGKSATSDTVQVEYDRNVWQIQASKSSQIPHECHPKSSEQLPNYVHKLHA